MSIYSTPNVHAPDWLSEEDRRWWREGYLDAVAWVPVATPNELASMTTNCAQNTIDVLQGRAPMRGGPGGPTGGSAGSPGGPSGSLTTPQPAVEDWSPSLAVIRPRAPH